VANSHTRGQVYVKSVADVSKAPDCWVATSSGHTSLDKSTSKEGSCTNWQEAQHLIAHSCSKSFAAVSATQKTFSTPLRGPDGFQDRSTGNLRANRFICLREGSHTITVQHRHR